MDREALYARLPIPLQDAACSIEGWRIARTRFNARFHALLGEYTARAKWSAEERAAYRDDRLRRFIQHAVESTPHYRELFSRFRLAPADIRGLEDLAKLPLLTKAEVQAAPERFTSCAVPVGGRVMMHTSGSTGAGLRFASTQDAQREHWAVWWRFRGLHGLPFGTPCAYFGGRSIVPLSQRRPPFWRHNRPGRQLLFSGYHLSPANAPAYLDALAASGIEWLHGYPSLIALLAGFALEQGRRLPMRWVSLGAEGISARQRALIAEAFGVTPISHYSMAEAVANISQHPDGAFYVDEDFAAVEFVSRDDGRFDVVGTNFTNPAFPLIRYVVGDIASLPAAPPAGAFGRQVLQIDGRSEDYVITKSGARLGRLDHIFKDMVHVREAQIVQARAGHMALHIVKGAGFGADDEVLLRAEVLKRVGDDVDFEIVYREEISRGPGGKLRFVMSTLK